MAPGDGTLFSPAGTSHQGGSSTFMAEKDQHEAPKAAGLCVPSERAEPLSALVPQLVPLELMSKEEAMRPSLACRSLGSLVRLRRGIL